jgi:hypothetical protein
MLLIIGLLIIGTQASTTCDGISQSTEGCECQVKAYQTRITLLGGLVELFEGGNFAVDASVVQDLKTIRDENVLLEKREKAKRFLVPAIITPLLLN